MPEPGPRPGIRRAMVAGLLLPLLLLVPAAAALLHRRAQMHAHDALDRSLDGTAQALERLVDTPRSGRVRLRWTPDVGIALRGGRVDPLVWVVRAPDGQVLGGDAGLLALGAAPAPGAGPLADTPRRPIGGGVADTTLQGPPLRIIRRAWRCDPRATAPGGGMCELRIGAPLRQDGDGPDALPAIVAGAMMAEALVLAAGAWFAVGRRLRPVARLRGELERRGPDAPGALDCPDLPRELVPLVAALDGLLARARVAMAAEKTFLADAAHQLRIPLTALQTETELALRAAPDARDDALLRRLHRGSTRAARLAHQWLALARAEHAGLHAPLERVDLGQIAADAAETWVARSIEQGMDLGFELASAPVDGHGALLQELLANLLHNALTHAGAGTRVTVRTRLEGGPDGGSHGFAVLEVEDNGPGIPAPARERAFERFQRGQAGGSGSGLGLSIVRDIVRRHRGHVELLDGPAAVGLRVRVRLPAATATAQAPLPGCQRPPAGRRGPPVR